MIDDESCRERELDVPRAGTSHQFMKPLVVDQVTAVTFRYKRR